MCAGRRSISDFADWPSIGDKGAIDTGDPVVEEESGGHDVSASTPLTATITDNFFALRTEIAIRILNARTMHQQIDLIGGTGTTHTGRIVTTRQTRRRRSLPSGCIPQVIPAQFPTPILPGPRDLLEELSIGQNSRTRNCLGTGSSSRMKSPSVCAPTGSASPSVVPTFPPSKNNCSHFNILHEFSLIHSSL